MLQHMPKASPLMSSDGATGEDGLMAATDALDSDGAENWNRANTLLDTVEEMELVGPTVSPSQLLLRLFHEEKPRIYEAQDIRFGCSCSPERVRDSLSIYSAKDIAHMTTDDGKVTADCQFCGSHYEFDPATLGFEANDADPAS
jgi:molecular chaperone Hsp33